MELEKMLEKYSPRASAEHSGDGSEVGHRPVPASPEELDAYWQQSIYRKDGDVLEMFSQARGETMTESDGLLLLQAILLRRGLKELAEVIRDGFQDIRKILEAGKTEKENDGLKNPKKVN